MPESALSIAIPVRNHAVNLAASWRRLRRAKVQPLDLIVVDDASVKDAAQL